MASSAVMARRPAAKQMARTGCENAVAGVDGILHFAPVGKLRGNEPSWMRGTGFSGASNQVYKSGFDASDARSKRIAIGHFDVSDLVALPAVTAAARALKVTVLIGTSEGERDFIGDCRRGRRRAFTLINVE